MNLFILLLLYKFGFSMAERLPTLYEYYTEHEITSGLSVDQQDFTLNGKKIVIYSGSMHYFRIPFDYWRDRLRKLRASGLNTVETYVAWNLHEYQNGTYDFGQEGSEMETFLSVRYFIELAQEEDLFVILRLGPYIGAEWEWGGLPSWLLHQNDVKVRTSDESFMTYVRRYFNLLLPQIDDLQFTKGGAIIAVQVESEYGSTPQKDLNYLMQLVEILRSYEIAELLVTSDMAASKQSGTVPGALFQTVNVVMDPEASFEILKKMQPGKPVMAMQYWTGRFDHWSEKHHTSTNRRFRKELETILEYPASFNLYMFHGGTNWGFMNGGSSGSEYQPATTSSDCDSALSEAGDYTEKYKIVLELMEIYNQVKTFTPDPPELIPRIAYPSITIENQMSFTALVNQAPSHFLHRHSMEELPINRNSGQSYGYLIYRKQIDISANSILSIEGHIHDTLMVLVNGKLISKPLLSVAGLDGFGYWKLQNSSITLSEKDLTNAVLDLVIENFGRVNAGKMYHQRKGLTKDNRVLINGKEINGWHHIPLQFKKTWTAGLRQWSSIVDGLERGPALFKATLSIEETPIKDTFIDMQHWTKGVVMVNGFVLGRYAVIGPQQALYLPAPFLKVGNNEIIVFEQFIPAEEIKFSENPIFNTK